MTFVKDVDNACCCYVHHVTRGGAPIGAGGVMTPPLFEAKGDGGHNLGIIH